MTSYFELEFHPNLDNRYSSPTITWPNDDSFLYLRLYLP